MIPIEGLAYKICTEADHDTEDYLYSYGEYIGDNERGLSKYLAELPEEEIVPGTGDYMEKEAAPVTEGTEILPSASS